MYRMKTDYDLYGNIFMNFAQLYFKTSMFNKQNYNHRHNYSTKHETRTCPNRSPFIKNSTTENYSMNLILPIMFYLSASYHTSTTAMTITGLQIYFSIRLRGISVPINSFILLPSILMSTQEKTPNIMKLHIP